MMFVRGVCANFLKHYMCCICEVVRVVGPSWAVISPGWVLRRIADPLPIRWFSRVRWLRRTEGQGGAQVFQKQRFLPEKAKSNLARLTFSWLLTMRFS